MYDYSLRLTIVAGRTVDELPLPLVIINVGIQTLVEFGEGFPSAIWKCMGSSFSWVQKKTT